jgi:hypothetical protein
MRWLLLSLATSLSRGVTRLAPVTLADDVLLTAVHALCSQHQQ